MSELVLKTIEECRVALVAHTVIPRWHLETEDPVDDLMGMHSWLSLSYESADMFPATAARVSFGDDLDEREVDRDKKLIKYLIDHKHMSCFEHQSMTLMIECPLFIRSQIHRHRTFSYNEISRRYTDESIEFWTPTTFRRQSSSNKQGSYSDALVLHDSYTFATSYERDYDQYLLALDNGICREQARALLPQALLTRFYMTGNLRNWLHFLELRLSEDSQYEVRVIAEKAAKHLTELWPSTMESLSYE